MKIAFLHNATIFCMGGSKGQSVQLTIRVISILECVNNDEDTNLN